MPKRVLYLSDYTVCVYSKKLKEIQEFDEKLTESDRIAYLRNEAHKPLYCLLDSIYEEYKITTIPHVFGRDKKNLINRKMGRLFENKSYTYVAVQGRESYGRRDDKILFTALNNTDSLTSWINAFKDNEIPLAGIYSVPLLSESLLNYLPKTPYTLLVAPTPKISMHSPLGLRQSFFAHQKIQLSRLIPLDTTQPNEYAERVIGQVIKMQQYLSNAQLLPQTHILSVIILAEPQFLVELAQYLHIHKITNQHIHIVDIQDFARQMGIPPTVETVHLNTLLAYQLFQHSFKNHYAKPNEMRHFLHAKLQRMMVIASIAILLIGIKFSGTYIYEAQQLKEKAREFEQTLVERRKSLEKQYGHLTISQAEVEYVENVTKTGQYINQRHIAPRTTWEKIGNILIHYPELKIEKLTWNVEDSAEELIDHTPQPIQTIGIEQPAQTTGRSLFGRKRVIIPQAVQESTYFFESLKLSGTVLLSKQDYMQLLEKFEQLKADLQKHEEYWTVKNVSVPSYVSDDELGTFEIEILIKHNRVNDSDKKPN